MIFMQLAPDHERNADGDYSMDFDVLAAGIRAVFACFTDKDYKDVDIDIRAVRAYLKRQGLQFKNDFRDETEENIEKFLKYFQDITTVYAYVRVGLYGSFVTHITIDSKKRGAAKEAIAKAEKAFLAPEDKTEEEYCQIPYSVR